MKYCVQENCYHELEEFAKFCVSCGSPQSSPCPNPNCEEIIALKTDRCPHCKSFLRYCPNCHKPYLLSQNVCTNHDWHPHDYPLEDFFQSFGGRGGNLQRNGYFAYVDGLRVPKDESEFIRGWKFSARLRISEVVTAVNRVFLADELGNVYSIPENCARKELTPESPEVERTLRPLRFPPGGATVQDFTFYAGYLGLLAGPDLTPDSFNTAGRFPDRLASCLRADLMQEVKNVFGPYQAQVLGPKGWYLFRFNYHLSRTEIDYYPFSLIGRSEPTKIMLGNGVILDDTINPVVSEDAIYFATMQNDIWKIDMQAGNAEKIEWSNQPMQTQPYSIGWMAWSEGVLLVLICDNKHCIVHEIYEYSQRSSWMLRRVTSAAVAMPVTPKIWVTNQSLLLHASRKVPPTINDFSRPDLIATTPRELPNQSTLNDMVIVNMPGDLYFITQVSKGGETYIQLMRQHDKHVPLTIQRIYSMSDVNYKYCYSNGRAYIYECKSGSIQAITVFAS